jgi:hypothetical protein
VVGAEGAIAVDPGLDRVKVFGQLIDAPLAQVEADTFRKDL